jgi:hypothetical protein
VKRVPPSFCEFVKRRDGMIHAMDGGLWLHRHVWKGKPLAHLVSTDKELLLAYGDAIGIPESRLQFKPLKDPRTGIRCDAWHWDLGGPVLPPVGPRVALVVETRIDSQDITPAQASDLARREG